VLVHPRHRSQHRTVSASTERLTPRGTCDINFMCRYQFFLQAKRDIAEGRLPVDLQLAAELAAYAVQCKIFTTLPDFLFFFAKSTVFCESVVLLHKILLFL